MSDEQILAGALDVLWSRGAHAGHTLTETATLCRCSCGAQVTNRQ